MSRFMIPFIGVTLAIVLSPLTTARGQETAETSSPPEGASAPSLTEVLEVILLPRVADEARREGVPEEDIQVVLDVSRERRLPAQETREVLEQTTEAVKAHGPIDGFGTFVRARLDEGLRGRDLAQAIAAEHRARGKGKASGQPDKGGGRGHETPAGKGKPDTAGQEPGRSTERDQAGQDKKPEQAKDKGKGGAS